MAICDQDVLDIPVRNTPPASTDLILITLLDGTSFITPWAQFVTGITPPAEEYEVVASGGDINNGDTTKTFANFVGKRLRLFRGGMRQTTIIQAGGSYYSFNPGTGQVTWSPAASTEEIFIFEPY